ncbi:MAG: DUF169 domain-containing protein [Methanospirillum sp.]|nr:DUF169 domain-containing protein [Methanospirillum sp.]
MRKGTDLAFNAESISCRGGERYCGYNAQIPPDFRYFLFRRWDHLGEGDTPQVVIFFARPEVFSGLFTLANYNRADPFGVIAPMGAGCSSTVHYPWHEQQAEDPKAILGMMDPSARPCIPGDILTFAVPMRLFTRMIENMEESFLSTPPWNRVMKKIKESSRQHAGIIP